MSYLDDASLVMIPSGYKDGKLYSIKPTDGTGDFTFTRGSNLAATRVDENGLIEKGRENLLLQSNQFDTTWTTFNASLTSGQNGYDGSNDAWLLSKSGANGYILQGISQSGVQTLSIYAKAGTLNWMRVVAIGGSSTPSTWFDLQNGVVGSANFFTIDANIESVGGGWYRCSITFEVSTITGVRFYPADGDNDISGTSGSIYIQDAQLEVGLVATDYIETGATTAQAGILEDMPRLDYTDASCPSLLLEPQRTNLVTHSEYLNGLSNKSDLLEMNTADTLSPEGVYNASKFDFSSGTRYIGNPTTSANDVVFSVFAKSGTHDFIQFVTSGSGAFAINFDLSNGSSNVIGTAPIELQYAAEDYGNGWYRIWVYYDNSGASSVVYWWIVDSLSSLRASSVSVSGNIYLFGIQLEQSSYATSYIPTYGSAVTRNADDSVVTGIGSIAGQSEGTLFAYFKTIGDSGTPYISLNQNNGVSNRVLIYNNSGVSAEIRVGGAIQASTTSSTQGLIKAAFAYKANDFAFYINGSQIGTDSSGITFGTGVLNELNLGFGAQDGAEMKQVLLFDTRLSNEELAALTTI